MKLVLGCTRKSDIAFDLPYAAALMILSARSCSCVLGQTGTSYFFDLFQKCYINAFRIVNPSGRIRCGNHLCTHLLCFLDGIDCYVSGTGYTTDLILHLHAMAFHQLTGDVQKAVTSCLGTCQRSAEGQSFTGQNALIASGQSLVLSIHIADLSSAGSDVTSRYIHICANIFVELRDETLAERHNLSVGFTLRIKIRSALAAADRQSGQRVLENLLKSQEFDNTDIYGRMKTDTSLVRSNGIIELYTITGVNLNLSLVVYPRYTELDLTIRLSQSLQQGFFSVLFLMGLNDRS